MEIQKLYGAEAPSAAVHDDGCIFLTDETGYVWIVIKPLPDGQPNHPLADAVVEGLKQL